MFYSKEYEFGLSYNNDSTLYPSIEPWFLLTERVVVGIVCLLSIVGGLLVVFSFLFNSETACKCKEVYYHLCCGYKIQENPGDDENYVPKYKLKSYNLILIHLSVADIIVAGTHFWGLMMRLEERFAPNDTESAMENNGSAIPAGYDISCTTQAAFTALSTLASFFWTDILLVFLVFNLLLQPFCHNNKLTGLSEENPPDGVVVLGDGKAPNCCESPLFLHILFPLIGWGAPAVMVVAFAAFNVLGYTESYDGGRIFLLEGGGGGGRWELSPCGIVDHIPTNSGAPTDYYMTPSYSYSLDTPFYLKFHKILSVH